MEYPFTKDGAAENEHEVHAVSLHKRLREQFRSTSEINEHRSTARNAPYPNNLHSDRFNEPDLLKHSLVAYN
jgi:hypothetical protein